MSGRLVLLVCTSSVTRALLSSLLGSSGDQVCAADSVAHAIAAASKRTPDVAIVEAAIVRASPETVERLRQAWPARIGVVVADRTYADERRGGEEARAFGATGFVALPPDPSALEDAIRRAIGGSGHHLSNAAPADVPDAEESAPGSDAEQTARYIERLWSRLDALDAYQMLRVGPGATQDEIRDAFRDRALEFHPDRLRPGLDEASRERIYQIFKRVSWAFRKVGDPNARKEYDRGSRR